MLNGIALLRRLRNGDRPAFESVIAAHYESVYRQLWYLCGDRDRAADLTQETFVQAWRSLPTYSGWATPRTWLHTLAVRVWHRSSAADRLNLRGALLPMDSRAEQATDPGHGPAECAQARALWTTIEVALDGLPRAYREAVRLYCVEDLRDREIADVLDIPIGTVKSRLHEGLRRLRLRLTASDEIIERKASD